MVPRLSHYARYRLDGAYLHIYVYPALQRRILSVVLCNCAVGTFTSSLTNVTGVVVQILNRLN